MIMNLRKNQPIVFSLFTMFMFLISCDNQAQYAYRDWDDNQDNMIDNNEFSNTFGETGYYSGIDADDDGVLNDEEFYTSYYDAWDTDDDGILNEDEWALGTDSYLNMGGNDEYGVFSDWDLDTDSQVNQDEFQTGMESLSYYDEWDANSDSYLSESEVAEGYFSYWDMDGDGYVDEVEYNDASERFNDFSS
jgi:hypothetical protein